MNEPQTSIALHDLLYKFKRARKSLVEALDAEKEIPALADHRSAKTTEFRSTYEKEHENCEPEKRTPEWNKVAEFIETIPEQKRINAIEKERKDTERDLHQLRIDVQPLLDRLREGKNANSFQALDALLLDEGLATVDRFISLVENILRASGPKQRPRKNATDSGVDEVKHRIREMIAAKMSHKDICERLGDSPRPRTVRWARLTWPAAYKHPDYQAAVTFISKQR